MAQQWITMRHPETGGEARVTQAAFDQDHQAKGWVVVPDDPPSPGKAAGRATPAKAAEKTEG